MGFRGLGFRGPANFYGLDLVIRYEGKREVGMATSSIIEKPKQNYPKT